MKPPQLPAALLAGSTSAITTGLIRYMYVNTQTELGEHCWPVGRRCVLVSM